MATYVLVAGAWHAGWCWERVVPLLESRGHRVLAPDLRGMGDDRTPPAAVSLAVWADQIADLVRQQEEPVVLVGHSRGGIVISEVAERVPDRIATLVYLAAFLVPAGDTMIGTLVALRTEPSPDVTIAQPDGTTIVAPEFVAPIFYNTTAPEWVARARDRLTPEPMAAMTTPLAIGAAFASVRRVYIECTQDRALPLAVQRGMQAALPCARVDTLDTDHSPFYSAPEALVACLTQAD